MRGVYWVLILCGGPLWAQQAAMRLTLEEAEQFALKNNPQLSSSRFLEQAAAQTPLELRAAYYPTFFGSVTGVGADGGSRIAAGALNNPALYSRFGTGVTLSQMVYDFGRTGDLVESARLRAQAQAQSTTATKDDLI
ncbi:MAG: TolC family protein, partial [Bryobacterales bacterium]|nr:TolC family protein [Bryobacterales bacterium]